jgi:CDP-ribitol ribitolphosphotransferase
MIRMGKREKKQDKKHKGGGGRVAIISRESNEKTLDVRMLEKELLSRGLKVTTLSRLLTKDSYIRALGYIGHVIKQEMCILRSDVVILDTYCIPASMLPHLGKTKVIQMWHALSAVKKFGWQTVGMPDGTAERTARLMRMHKGYDHFVCCSDVTADFFSEAFRTDRGKVIKCGLPRIDYIKDVVSGRGRDRALRRIYEKHPRLADAGRMTVLYAPTFHKGSVPDVKGLADALDPAKYDLLVRLHPLYRAQGEMPQAGNIIYEDDIPTYDLLAAADVIISDYSSLVVEASLADKPLYLYTYDIDAYSETTGLNMDFEKEAISAYVFRDAKQLAAAIGQYGQSELYGQSGQTGESGQSGQSGQAYDMDALRSFRDKYIDVSTENCTARLADIIEAMIE